MGLSSQAKKVSTMYIACIFSAEYTTFWLATFTSAKNDFGAFRAQLSPSNRHDLHHNT